MLAYIREVSAIIQYGQCSNTEQALLGRVGIAYGRIKCYEENRKDKCNALARAKEN